MTDMEIPQAAKTAAVEAYLAFRYADATEHGNRVRPRSLEGSIGAALEAALPHLFAEVKAMCETTHTLGLALGRKAALDDAVEAVRGLRHPTASGDHARGWNDGLRDATDRLRFIAKATSQPSGAASNGLTAAPASPGIPENPEAAESAFPDLPEESDQ